MIKDPPFSKKRILIADDDETMQDYSKLMLESEGFTVLLAANGEEAVNLAKAEAPDLILMDAEMPIMTGFEAIAKIRSDPKTRMIPIILCTALKKTEDRIKGIEAGCDNYISKPFDTHELVAQIKTLLTVSYYRTLLDEKEKFDYLINHMNSGIVVLDPDMRIKQINQKAQELLQTGALAEGDFDVVKHIYDQFKVLYDGDLRADIRTKTVTFELERPETNNFQKLYLSAMSSLIKNPAGELNSLVMILLDVTDQRKRDFSKLTFIEFVSHKLLTPLTSMEGSLDIMKERNESDELLNICVKQYAELKSRILNILTFCKALGGEFELPVEKINLSEYLSGLAGSLIQTGDGKKIHCEAACPDKNLFLSAEKKYFDLIMSNLTDNAIEHNDQETIQIKMEARASGKNVEISVSDNGRGIPPEDYERVFENFYQIDKWSTGNLKGVGLGLSIVKHIVERQGGSVRIDSKINRGTTFILTFKNTV